jgi:lipid II:glycine glycyltransferase (peptidoglycan interpeptide bridge formation enzyme)
MLIETNYKKIDHSIWSDFVYNHPQGNIFQMPEMVNVYTKTINYLPITSFALQKNKIIGLLIAVIQKEHNGPLGPFSSRCIVWGGPLVTNNDNSLAESLLSSLLKQVKNKAIYVQFRNIFDQSNFSNAFRNQQFVFHPHLDIEIDLSHPFAELKKSIHKSRLRNYTKSLNKGVVIKEINSKEEFEEGFNLVQKTYQKIKIPSPHSSLFYAIKDELIPKSLARCYSLFWQEKLIGFRIVLTFNGLIYDYYAGSDPDYSNKYPNDVLILKVLEEGCENQQFEKFDFGGAGRPDEQYGVRDHKLKFGGNIVEHGRYIRILNPFLYNLGKLGLQVLAKIR